MKVETVEIPISHRVCFDFPAPATILGASWRASKLVLHVLVAECESEIINAWHDARPEGALPVYPDTDSIPKSIRRGVAIIRDDQPLPDTELRYICSPHVSASLTLHVFELVNPPGREELEKEGGKTTTVTGENYGKN